MTGRPRVRRVTARLTIDLPKGTPYPAGTSADYIYDLSVSSAGVDPELVSMRVWRPVGGPLNLDVEEGLPVWAPRFDHAQLRAAMIELLDGDPWLDDVRRIVEGAAGGDVAEILTAWTKIRDLVMNR